MSVRHVDADAALEQFHGGNIPWRRDMRGAVILTPVRIHRDPDLDDATYEHAVAAFLDQRNVMPGRYILEKPPKHLPLGIEPEKKGYVTLVEVRYGNSNETYHIRKRHYRHDRTLPIRLDPDGDTCWTSFEQERRKRMLQQRRDACTRAIEAHIDECRHVAEYIQRRTAKVRSSP